MRVLLANCWENSFIFQQDRALTHRACDTVQFLKRATPELILPGQRAADLNVVAYTICSFAQQHVYLLRVQTVDQLKQQRLFAWNDGTEYYKQCSNNE